MPLLARAAGTALSGPPPTPLRAGADLLSLAAPT
jgi:hypothetical protein